VSRLLLEQASVGESETILLRSRLRAVANRMGMPAIQRERMELVLTEMVTNQNKYAGGSGLIQLWGVNDPGPAIDLFALDYGGGIANPQRAGEDGFTTSGTLGRGLGSIRRLASESALYTLPAGNRGAPWHGVAVWARFYAASTPPDGGAVSGLFLRSYHDAPDNGDCVALRRSDSSLRWLHLDGLGHGSEAGAVVAGLESVLDRDEPLEEMVAAIGRKLRGSRGAVGLVGELESASGAVRLCGVGDVMAWTLGSGKRDIHFAPGVLGHAYRHPRLERLTLQPGELLCTASDGMRRSWNEESFPGLWGLHPQMVALFLGSVAGKVNDDRSLLVLRGAHRQAGAVTKGEMRCMTQQQAKS